MTSTQQEIREKWHVRSVNMAREITDYSTVEEKIADWWLAEVEKAEGKGIREGFLAGQKAVVEKVKAEIEKDFKNWASSSYHTNIAGGAMAALKNTLVSLQTLEESLK